MNVDDWLLITRQRVFYEWDEEDVQRALIGFLALIHEEKNKVLKDDQKI